MAALPTYEVGMVESTNSSFCTSVLDSGLAVVVVVVGVVVVVVGVVVVVVVVVVVDADDLGSSSLKGVHSNRPGRGSSFCGSKLYLLPANKTVRIISTRRKDRISHDACLNGTDTRIRQRSNIKS